MAPFEDSHNQFVKYTDQQGNLLAAVVRDGSVLAQQVTFGDGTSQSSAASSGILTAKVTLTTTQWTHLHTTPIQIIAAPGAGSMILPLQFTLKFQPGTGKWTDTGAQYTFTYGPSSSDPSPGSSIAGSGLIDQTVPTTQAAAGNLLGGGASSALENVALYILNVSTEPTGGTGGTLEVVVNYLVQPM
jgi:hypothetical protein